MTRDLARLRPWITRPEPDLARSGVAWSDRGSSPLLFPTLSIEVLPVDPDGAARLRGLGADTVLALVSPRAAMHWCALPERELGVGGGWKAAAIGERSAAVARAAGLTVDLVAPIATGACLAEEILGRWPSCTVVLPSSDRRRPELGDALRAGGVAVIDIEVHRTVPVPTLDASLERTLREGRVDLIVAYSPSALLFLDALPADHPARRLPVAAMGETTAAAARSREMEVVAAPRQPGEEALLHEVSTWWAAR